MAGRLMQLNFHYDVTAEQYEGAVTPLAESFAAIPGLVWKIWILNEEEKEAGAIYLFDDQASVDRFLASELAGKVTGHPALRDFSVKTFDVMPEQTAITRGPVERSVAS